MYNRLNDKRIKNNQQNTLEDKHLNSEQLFNKYYYLRRHFRQYLNYLDPNDIENELLLILDIACKGWIKNKIYLRGTPGSDYSTSTFFTTHFKGYVTGYRGNYFKKLYNDAEKSKNVVVYVSSTKYDINTERLVSNDYGYEEMINDYKSWED